MTLAIICFGAALALLVWRIVAAEREDERRDRELDRMLAVAARPGDARKHLLERE